MAAIRNETQEAVVRPASSDKVAQLQSMKSFETSHWIREDLETPVALRSHFHSHNVAPSHLDPGPATYLVIAFWAAAQRLAPRHLCR